MSEFQHALPKQHHYGPSKAGTPEYGAKVQYLKHDIEILKGNNRAGCPGLMTVCTNTHDLLLGNKAQPQVLQSVHQAILTKTLSLVSDKVVCSYS